MKTIQIYLVQPNHRKCSVAIILCRQTGRNIGRNITAESSSGNPRVPGILSGCQCCSVTAATKGSPINIGRCFFIDSPIAIGIIITAENSRSAGRRVSSAINAGFDLSGLSRNVKRIKGISSLSAVLTAYGSKITAAYLGVAIGNAKSALDAGYRTAIKIKFTLADNTISILHQIAIGILRLIT